MNVFSDLGFAVKVKTELELIVLKRLRPILSLKESIMTISGKTHNMQNAKMIFFLVRKVFCLNIERVILTGRDRQPFQSRSKALTTPQTLTSFQNRTSFNQQVSWFAIK